MYELAPFRDVPLDEGLLAHLIEEHEHVTLPRLARLWRYFRNELADPPTPSADRTILPPSGWGFLHDCAIPAGPILMTAFSGRS